MMNFYFGCTIIFTKLIHSIFLPSSIHYSKEYQCDTCGKEFKSKGGLETHQLLHDTQRENYKCEICGKNFVTKVGHAQHIVNVHEDSKKYPCDVCGQSFIPRDLCIKFGNNGIIRNLDK